MGSTWSELGGTPDLPAGEAPRIGGAAISRRLGAGAVDGLVLGAGLALVLSTELALVPDEASNWFLYGWLAILSPLYFALYHAYGNGATPGGTELRIGLRDVRTGTRPTLARALARSYLGLAFGIVVPLFVADLLALSNSGRSLRDRLTRTHPVPIELEGKAAELAAETIAELRPLFEPAAGAGGYLRRGWTLVTTRPRLIVGCVGALYAVLLALAAILAFLFVGDAADPFGLAFVGFLFVLVLLLASGAYWAQAVVVTAVELVRVGNSGTVSEVLRRALRRVNALSAALGLGLAALLLPFAVLVAVVVVGRLALVPPALVLEDTRVLGAFQRSWQLTEGRTWRLLGLTLVSGGLLIALAIGEVLLLASLLAESDSTSWLTLALQAVLVSGLGAIPTVLLLAWLGATWSLVYHDARRALPAGATR